MRTSSLSTTRLLGALLIVLGLSVGTAQAQGLGVLGGANFNRLSDIEGADGDTFDNASGYHVGLFYDLTLGPLALRPAVVYVDVGEFDTGDLQASADRFDIRLVEVPIDARFRFGTPLLSPYVMAGPVFRFNASNNDGFEDAFEDVSVGANVGLGVELSVPGVGLTLYPEVRYQFGISDFWDGDAEVFGADVDPQDSQLSTFMLRLGVAF